MFFVLIFQACKDERKTNQNSIPENDSLHTIDSPFRVNTRSESSAKSFCDCTPVHYKDQWDSEIKFGEWMISDGSFDTLFKKYSHDSIRLKIKSLTLQGFNDIPKEMKIFSKVKHILFYGGIKDLKGLDMFPKLISVNFFGCVVTIDTTQNWLQRLELLYLGKSVIKGITSFKHLPHLKSLHIGHSGFEYTPQDIHSLTCLQELNIEEYKFAKGEFPVRQMDLMQFPCLRKVRFWGGTSGLPVNIDSIHDIEIVVRPWQLSEDEKKKYEAYKKRYKKK